MRQYRISINGVRTSSIVTIPEEIPIHVAQDTIFTMQLELPECIPLTERHRVVFLTRRPKDFAFHPETEFRVHKSRLLVRDMPVEDGWIYLYLWCPAEPTRGEQLEHRRLARPSVGLCDAHYRAMRRHDGYIPPPRKPRTAARSPSPAPEHAEHADQ